MARTCAEAVKRVAELRPDVVLVDMTLGDECGLEVAQLLAGDGHGDVPVVILISAYSPAGIAELVATSPVAGFLPKSDLSADAICPIVLSSGRVNAVGGWPAVRESVRRRLVTGQSGGRLDTALLSGCSEPVCASSNRGSACLPIAQCAQRDMLAGCDTARLPLAR
jgi:CheY-like chemotaxis protein